MGKVTTKSEADLFSFSDIVAEKKIQVDFNAPDISYVSSR